MVDMDDDVKESVADGDRMTDVDAPDSDKTSLEDGGRTRKEAVDADQTARRVHRRLGQITVENIHNIIKGRSALETDSHRVAKSIETVVDDVARNQKEGSVEVKDVIPLDDGRLEVVMQLDGETAGDKPTIHKEIDLNELNLKSKQVASDEQSRIAKHRPNMKGSERAGKVLGAYGIAMGLLSGSRALEEGDYGRAALGFAQAGHGISSFVSITVKGEKVLLNDKIQRTIVNGLGKVVEKAVQPLSKVASVGLKTVGKSVASAVGKFARAVPVVGIGFSIYGMYEDIQAIMKSNSIEDKVHFGINLALDSAILLLDIASMSVVLAPIAVPLSLVLTVVRIFIDDIWGGISSAVKKVDCSNLSGGECFLSYTFAVIKGAIKGVYNLLRTLSCIIYCKPWKALEETRDFKADFYNLDNYYGVGERDSVGYIDFTKGSHSFYGGNIYFNLEQSGTGGNLCITIDDSYKCRNLNFHNSKRVSDIILSYGKSKRIKYKEVRATKRYQVMDKLEDIEGTLHGAYHGNNENNKFFPLTEDKDKSLPYRLEDYSYELYGHGGDDTFFIGPQKYNIIGGDGKDTYIINEKSGSVTMDVSANDDEYDICLFQTHIKNLKSHRYKNDLHIHFSRYSKIVLKNWFKSKKYQQINFFAEPGIFFDISLTTNDIHATVASLSSKTGVNFVATEPYYKSIFLIKGTDHSDTLYGNDIDNQIVGNKGDDLMSGGEGNDQYIIDKYQGNDVINNYANDKADDILFTDTDILGVRSEIHGKDLKLLGQGISVTLQNWFKMKQYQHLYLITNDFITSQISMSDGCSRNDSCVRPLSLNATNAQKAINVNLQKHGYEEVIHIEGSNFNDQIIANDKANLINGKLGDDVLQGGLGADIYVIEHFSGQKEIRNEAEDEANDMLILQKVNFNQLSYSAEHENLQIKITNDRGHVQKIMVRQYFNSTKFQHLLIKTADGVTITSITEEDISKRDVGPGIIENVDTTAFDVNGDCHPVTNSSPINTSLANNQVCTKSCQKCEGAKNGEKEFKMEKCTSDGFSYPSQKLSRIISHANCNHLEGTAGNNVFSVQGASNFLKGNNGSDIYELLPNATSTIVIDNYAADNKVDMVVVNASYQEITVSRDGLDLELNYPSVNGIVSVFVDRYYESPDRQHLVIKTSDGANFAIQGDDKSTSNRKKRDVQDIPKAPIIIPLSIDLSQAESDQLLDLSTDEDHQEFQKLIGSREYSNRIIAGKHDAVLEGGEKGDILEGGKGNDVLHGRGGDNLLFGNEGDDVLYGGPDRDYMIGGEGHDIFFGDGAGDVIDGGSGYDTVLFYGDPEKEKGVFVDLLEGVGHFADAEGDFYHHVECVFGSEFDDFLIGSLGDDTLRGEGGNDVLVSLTGTDALIGGQGANYYILTQASGVKVINICHESAIMSKDDNHTLTDMESESDTIFLPNANFTYFDDKSDTELIMMLAHKKMSLVLNPFAIGWNWLTFGEVEPFLTVVLHLNCSRNQSVRFLLGTDQEEQNDISESRLNLSAFKQLAEPLPDFEYYNALMWGLIMGLLIFLIFVGLARFCHFRNRKYLRVNVKSDDEDDRICRNNEENISNYGTFDSQENSRN